MAMMNGKLSVQGSPLARTPSRETLAVHPLLNEYVPYTPRRNTKLANLRAAAQQIGLDAGSVGWAILDKIAHDGDEWSEIWTVLTKSRATLLLPTETGTDTITVDLVQDHLIDIAVVTLSGLRGHLANDALSFRSTAKPFATSLPPLPAFPSESSYPAFAVSASATLPLPARSTKPPLPPRPNARPTQTTPRLMPFASLFGQRPSTPPPPTATPTPTPTTAPPTDTDTAVDINVLVIDTVLSKTEIATSIINALKGEIAIALNDQPPWLVERVHTFSLPYLPFVKVPAGKKKLQDIGGNPNRFAYAVNSVLDKPEQLADKFQAFYRSVEEELRQGEVDETRIRDVLETVEATLCTLLYDRLFLPSTSDDASHNEALSSRIAALNMLDLGLEHLDVDIGNANHAEVDAIVRTCGETLAQLDASARSPREKAAVLVSAHKSVVDGLSKIPPVRLKSRDESVKVDTSPSIRVASPLEIESPSMPANQSLPSEDAPPTSSPISGDVLLPILIFSVVKANPSRLVSHLLYTQRFRNQAFGGEESYCLINLMAVAEFLENVDLGALGLGESEKKVLSTADLTPIPITRPNLPESPIALTVPDPASLRGRVEQGVDAIAGSANKVISGVVDSSFGVLRAFLPGQTQSVPTTVGTGARQTDATPWGVRPVLRRETGFSIAGLTVGLPGHGKGRGQLEEGQRELVEVVSKPPSLRGRAEEVQGLASEEEEEGSAQGSDGEDTEDGNEEAEVEADGQEDKDEGDEEEGEEGEDETHDARSIKSFESMLSSGRTKHKTTVPSRRRKRLNDLTDRLTHGMAGMSRRGQGGETVQRGTLPIGRVFPPPNRRFMECTEQDIRVSEVGELLREYQRLVEGVRTAGGFQE